MKTFWLLLLLGPALFATAQKRNTSALNAELLAQNKAAITFSPLAILQIDYTALAGAEYRLNPKLRLAADAGYIFASSYYGNDNANASSVSGFLFRPGVKWFFMSRSNYYLHGQVFYKQVNHRMFDWLDKGVVNGVPAYQQLQSFTYRRTAYGANFIVGFMEPFGRNTQKFFVDVYLGVGVRWKKFGVPGEPDSRISRWRGTGSVFNDGDVEGQVYPSLPAAIRLVFLL